MIERFGDPNTDLEGSYMCVMSYKDVDMHYP